ncbi:MAG TPA: DUF4147 domain-containing protein [Candidatus Dormibacteraeota bacterium]|nr:DUF4147 domain-containing protein [Candidatus Dormibacteraeota bacterium]
MAELKQLARQIFQETLAAIDIPSTMRRKLRCEGMLLHGGGAKIDLSVFGRVYIIAIGKAAHAMLEGLRDLLPSAVTFEGIVSAPTPPRKVMRDVTYFVAGHPVPNEQSWEAAVAILELLGRCDEHTLVFFLLSGGGSALVELPLDWGQALEDVQEVNRALVSCGAPIDAINTVRKHISAIKGGRLAKASGRATKVTMAVTDVPLGKESALASGPTVPDPTTISDVRHVVAKYSLRAKLPAALLRWIDEGKMPETSKADDGAFLDAHFWLLLGMDDLFHPAHRLAAAAGCVPCCDNTTDDWQVEKAARYLLQQLEDLRKANPGRRVAMIADGEVSSPVAGDGVGGRNSAFVLACVEKIAGRRIAVLSAGTDGIDGNSPAAGGVADGQSLARARALGLDPGEAFRRSDAYSFFARLDDAIVTGPMGNNLRDLRILIAEP